MKSRKSDMQSTCAPLLKMVVMVPATFKVVSAPHTGAQDFVQCTTSGIEEKETWGWPNRFSCKAFRWKKGFGSKLTSLAIVGNGLLIPIKVMGNFTTRERSVRRTGWPMNYSSGQFLKDSLSTIFVVIVSALIPPIWNQSPTTRTCCEGRVSKRRINAKHTAFEDTHFQGTISRSTKELVGELAGHVYEKATEEALNAYDRNNPHESLKVRLSQFEALGRGNLTQHQRN